MVIYMLIVIISVLCGLQFKYVFSTYQVGNRKEERSGQRRAIGWVHHERGRSRSDKRREKKSVIEFMRRSVL